LNVGTGPGKRDASRRNNRRDVFFATPERRRRFHTPAEIGGMLREAGFAQIEWHDIYRVGPLLLVAGVTARKA
jgi:hypothetical protein